MNYKIENEYLSILISNKGAELQSLVNKETHYEYLWKGDAKFWPKKSPVLFPIVGSLKNNSYEYNGKTYELGRHGFARDMEFEVEAQNIDSITFFIKDNEDTLLNYPFHFKFSVKYSLQDNEIFVEYFVENTGGELMYFSVGGHPAFKLPLVEGTKYEDYFLLFNVVENIGNYPLSKDGLIEENANSLLNDTPILPLKKSLFYKDALVLKSLRSDSIAIATDQSPHGLNITFQGFPYFGIWAAKDADFVCLEPWCGIADTVLSTGKLEEKEGINKLNAKEIFTRGWSVELV